MSAKTACPHCEELNHKIYHNLEEVGDMDKWECDECKKPFFVELIEIDEDGYNLDSSKEHPVLHTSV